jgi:hypothetical protein
MIEAVSTSETLSPSMKLQGTTSQKSVIFMAITFTGFECVLFLYVEKSKIEITHGLLRLYRLKSGILF